MSRHPLQDDLADRIRRLREERGLTISEAARRLGVDRQVVYQNEDTGRQSGYQVQTLLNIAEIFDLELHIEFREKLDERTAAMAGK